MWSTGGGAFLLQAILSLLLSIVEDVLAQQSQTNYAVEQQQQRDIVVSFRPSIAIVIGIFSIIFSMTFLLLMYAKFCNTAVADLYGHDQNNQQPNSLLSNNRFSGIDKSIIESLPFFRFSALKGTREGLECAICLSKFEYSEVLRLLPKCKHAFHINCVDRWLENHSSCPLCRNKIEVEDLTLFKYSNSSRFLFGDPSDRNQNEVELGLFVEREVGNIGPSLSSSSKFSIGGSFRKVAEWGTRIKRDHESTLVDAGGDEERGKFDGHLHKFKHKIIVSDVVFKNRWSDLNYADLTSMNFDMIHSVSSRRFSALDSNSQRFLPRSTAATTVNVSSSSPNETILKIKAEMERKRALESKMNEMITGISNPNNPSTSKNTSNPRSSIADGKRCMSEITNLSRSMISTDRNRIGADTDEKVKKVWLPIASRTVQWFAGRERKPQPQDHHEQHREQRTVEIKMMESNSLESNS